MADGIDPNNPDVIRANGQHVIFDYQDFNGYGTSAPTDGREAFLDAGTIASQANQTYDLSGFVNPAHPLPSGCNIKIKGIAPGASLAVMNLSGPNAGFFNSTIIQGIQWAVLHDHVNILNESIQGRVAAYSLLGSDQTGFGHVEVRQPAARAWTAVIFTVNSTATPADSGGSVRVTVPAGQAGDESYRLHLGTGAADDGSIPIVSSGGQSFTYQFRMPRGQPELNLGVRLADSNYQLEGFFTDPNGEPLDDQSTAAFDANDKLLGFGPTMQFFHAKPSAGLRTVTLLVDGPVDGTHLSEPFQGAISFARISSSILA